MGTEVLPTIQGRGSKGHGCPAANTKMRKARPESILGAGNPKRPQWPQ
jgi:hypothetical protein